MLKKTITFDDLDGNKVTEDFYFNLNPAEIAELELSERGGLGSRLKAIAATEEPGKILAAFKDIIVFSVGRRSDDGRRFIKSKEITDEFLQSEAYSELFLEFLKDVNAGIAFIQGIIPANLREKVALEASGGSTPTLPVAAPTQVAQPAQPELPAWIREDRDPTPAEFTAMDQAQMAAAFQAKQRRQEAAVAAAQAATQPPTA